MTAYELWKYLHILMLVFWLGTDMGVMLCAKKSTDASLSMETRFMLLKMALLIELLPRTMWALALPTGMHLSMGLGILDVSGTTVALVWIFTAIWWAISMTGAHWSDQPIGIKAGAINRWIIGGLGVGLIGIAAVSAAGNGPFDPNAGWLLAKVGLYGLVNLTILGIEISFLPLGSLFGQLATAGSTPALEEQITAKMNVTMRWVYTTYLLIAFVAFVGTTKIF